MRSECLLQSLAISSVTQRQRVPRLVTRDLAASVESGRYLIPLLERELAKAFLRSVLAACTVSGSRAQTCWPSGSIWSCLSRWKSRPEGACKALTKQILKALTLEAKLVTTECLYKVINIYLNVFTLCICIMNVSIGSLWNWGYGCLWNFMWMPGYQSQVLCKSNKYASPLCHLPSPIMNM